MEYIDAVIIGAGVVGLACARELTRRGIKCVVLERHDAIGTEVSARNSEVIHSGLYYPSTSLKAKLSVAGNPLLYDFCTKHRVSCQPCGKLIVANSSAQDEKLDELRTQGEANGITNLQPLSAREAQAIEPELRCTSALFSPSTGIIDSRGLMLALLADAEAGGAIFALRSPLMRWQIENDGIRLEVGGAEPMLVKVAIAINAAGLGAQRVAASLVGFPIYHVPPTYYAKGNYYSLVGHAPFSHLIYPLPEPGGLGVHLTIDLGGQARFGPDVEWIPEVNYHVDPARADRFYKEVRRYWPGLRDSSLVPAYAGIRPKITGPDSLAADFMIQGPSVHKIQGLVNLFGIESPGLTSCLSIAEHAVNLVT